MKYLDQACGLRLKTAVKVIAIIGMVASLTGFSIAVNRLTKMPATANKNKTTDAQALINDTSGDSNEDSANSIADVTKAEEYLEDNQEDGSNVDIGFEATTVSPDGDGHWNDSTEDVYVTETAEEDTILRSKREADSNASTGALIEGQGPDPISPVVPETETSSENVAILPEPEYDTDEADEAGQSSVSPGSAPVTDVTAAPEAELPSTSTTTISSTTDNKIEDVTATEAEEIVEHSGDLPESMEKKVPLSANEESYHYDENVTEEAANETETEQTTVKEPHNHDSLDDASTDEDEDDGETAEDDDESGPSKASWAVTGLGVPICLLGFVANAVLLHSAKKAEKKLLSIWILWAGILFMYQICAMIVNLHDLSPYIFSNLLLTMLSVGAGYVVLSYSKQLSDPSSYDLKTIEMNGYSMNKGFMEVDNKEKGASGSSAAGDSNV